MIIQIAAGTGTGPTKLAAFDSALHEAGVENFNLIKLSSIVPPGAKIINNKGKVTEKSGGWGDRLYVVMADMRVDTPNAEAWAGIGWVQDKKTGQGLFVEHEGSSRATVKKDIEQSLQALMAIRKVNFGQIHMKITGLTCTHEPVCALVIAVFQATSWRSGLKSVTSRANS